jgi:hypothetical protein
MNDLLGEALIALRRAALRAVARCEGLPADDWRIEKALQRGAFESAIDELRSHAPWYARTLSTLRFWLRRAGLK